MPRTIPPIRQQAPDAWPSILTVAQEGGLADAYTLDPAAGWSIGVQQLDIERFTYFVWPPDNSVIGAVVPSGSGDPDDDTDPDRPYLTEKPGPEFPELTRFYPWTFGVNLGCDPASMTPPGEDYEAWSTAAIGEATARAVSRELWTGYTSQGHCLTRDAVDLTPGGAVPFDYAVGLIQEAVEGFGTWHVPAVAEATMRGEGLVTDQGMVPRGPGGWPISFGPSYLRNGPVSSPWRPDTRLASGGSTHSSASPAGAECWIIGHAGRIEVAVRDAPINSRYRQALTGLTESMRERRSIFRYSLAGVYAALVNLTAEAGS